MPKFRGHIRNYFGDRLEEERQANLAMEEQMLFQQMFEDEMRRREEAKAMGLGFNAQPPGMMQPQRPLGLLDIFRRSKPQPTMLES